MLRGVQVPGVTGAPERICSQRGYCCLPPARVDLVAPRPGIPGCRVGLALGLRAGPGICTFRAVLRLLLCWRPQLGLQSF